MYDVMASDRRRRRRAAARRSGVPERHRTIDAEETKELLPALAVARADLGLPLLRLPDRRRPAWCSRCSVRRSASARSAATRWRPTGLIERDGRAAGVLRRDAIGGDEFELAGANVINATGVWADRLRPGRAARRGGGAADPAEPRHPRDRLARRALPVVAGVVVPAGAGRSIFVLPWLGRTLIGTTDNDYEGSLDHVPPVGGGHRLPARRHQQLLRHRAVGARTSPAPTPACGRSSRPATRRSRWTSRARRSSTRPARGS